MELDEFITKSLSSILKGMRDFQDEEGKRVPPGGFESDPRLDEGASVFPELSAKSGELVGSGLLKAAEIEGFQGRSTIMTVGYEVLVSTSNGGIGVVEGKATVFGVIAAKLSAKATYSRNNSQRLAFTIPLALPLPTRTQKREKKGMHTVASGSYEPFNS